ncbi:MAG: hypothetical protein AABZ47_01700 [Planctomycetota bacterium]
MAKISITRPFRVYVDTSTIGGCFDPEFATDSLRQFDLVRSGFLSVVASDVVFEELKAAPSEVRDVLATIPAARIERVTLTDEIITLRDAYIRVGVVSERWRDDATHVAAATVARADAIVSWNFKHIVRLDRIKAYNQVNLANGYGILTILSPREVRYEDEE